MNRIAGRSSAQDVEEAEMPVLLSNLNRPETSQEYVRVEVCATTWVRNFSHESQRGVMKSSPEDARSAALVLIEKPSVNPSHVHTLGCFRPVIVDFVFHIVGHFDFARERRCVERE